jgi:hypothetical protein
VITKALVSAPISQISESLSLPGWRPPRHRRPQRRASAATRSICITLHALGTSPQHTTQWPRPPSGVAQGGGLTWAALINPRLLSLAVTFLEALWVSNRRLRLGFDLLQPGLATERGLVKVCSPLLVALRNRGYYLSDALVAAILK